MAARGASPPCQRGVARRAGGIPPPEVIGGGAPYTKNGRRAGSDHIAGNSAAPAAGFFLSDQKETKESPGDGSAWTPCVQIRLTPGPPFTGDALFWPCGRGRRGWPPEGRCSLLAAALLNLRGRWFCLFTARLDGAAYTVFRRGTPGCPLWGSHYGAPARAQRSGSRGESRSSGMRELSPPGGSEGYGACDDEGRGLLDASPQGRPLAARVSPQ